MRKKIISTVCVILLLVQSVPVYGTTPEEAGFDLMTIMEYILDHYAGSEVDAQTLYYGAMKGMFQTLDNYSEFYTPEEFEQFFVDLSDSFYGIGAELRLSEPYAEVVNVYEGSPAQAAGLLTGDIITAVDGQSIEGYTLDEIVYLIRGEIGTEVRLKVLREDSVFDVIVVRGEINVSEVTAVDLKDYYSEDDYPVLDKIQYVAIDQFSAHVSEDFRDVMLEAVLNDKEYLMIDLRDNPGGYLESALAITRLLVPEGPILYTVNKQGEEEVYYSQLKRSPFKHLVILVNEYSASASEVFASAVQDSGIGVLVGEQTYGKGVVQNIFPYKQSGFKLTTEEYFSRNYQKIDGIGLTPDIEVHLPEFLPEMYKTYTEGNNDDYVQMIEEVLVYLGYLSEADTSYDEQTSEAIKIFQEEVGLEKTGMSDTYTISALNGSLYNSYLAHDLILEEALHYFEQYDKNIEN